MEQHYNRRERRNLAKNLGLLKTKNALRGEEKTAFYKRTQEAGGILNRQYLQEVHNSLKKYEAEKELQMRSSLLASGLSEEKVDEIIANNRNIDAEREN